MNNNNTITLSERIEILKEKGYFNEVNIIDAQAWILEKSYAPNQLKIVDYYRFEGETDPSDNSVLYAIETEDNQKGILIEAYGVYSNANTSAFLQQISSVEKPTDNL